MRRHILKALGALSLCLAAPLTFAQEQFSTADATPVNVDKSFPSSKNGLFSGGVLLEVVNTSDGSPYLLFPQTRSTGYVAAKKGEKFALRVRNTTPNRVMAVLSVDGVNLLSGEVGDGLHKGYVLRPFESMSVERWKGSKKSSYALEFGGDLTRYAQQPPLPEMAGVIGLDVFGEHAPLNHFKMVERGADSAPTGRFVSGPIATLPGDPFLRNKETSVRFRVGYVEMKELAAHG
ncbi:hypothetical protein LC612_40760, partial [Nostoc sp. CHAB 5834]|nr:hypothetical protein [Nostoc sp. CHAB 5834]